MTSGINASFPLFWNQYGDVGAFCWVTMPESGPKRISGFALRFAIRYCQIVVIIIFNGSLYIKLYYKLKELLRLDKDNEAGQRARRIVRKFMYYPSKLFFLFLLPVACKSN